MTPDERQLITGLFDRMRGVGQISKDRDAEALISQMVRQNPDAAYMLVQSVLVQENTLQQAGARMEELEARVRELESMGQRAAPTQASGGFLGGLFGGGQRPAASSVPPAGRPGMGYGQQPQQSAPWGQQPMQQQAPAAGGGFLKTAMATAAGVAGGMLLADQFRNMMGGGATGHGQGPTAASTNVGEGHEQTGGTQSAGFDNNDPGTFEPTPTSGGGWGDDSGWGGGGGGDEI